ncbi:RND family transporter [Candidatus Margulisiibacteriota bacterium]
MLIKLGEFIKKHYKLVLLCCLLFTILSIYWVSQLKLNMQMMDLLPAKEPAIVAYKDALDNFSGIDTISVVIEGTEENIISYIEDVRHKLAKLEHVDRILYKTETDFLKKYGLLLLKEKDLKSFGDVLTAASIKDYIKGLNNNFEKEYIASEETEKISEDKMEMLYVFNNLEDFLNNLKKPPSNKQEIHQTAESFLIGPKYMISPDRTLGVIFIRTSIPVTDLERGVPFIRVAEKLVKDSQEKYGVTAGVSGFLVLQRDEMDAGTSDMNKSSALSLVLILTIFYLGFRLIRYSILAVVPLIVGVIWSLGITYVVIGSLNIFTAMMGAILIGLGIDYAIHIIALYTEERLKGTSVEEAITQVFKKTVKGVITGSITTAIGFSMFAFSSFRGFAEFGLSLGLGILCILVASVLMLPSLFLIFGRKPVKPRKKVFPVMSMFEKAVFSRPRIVIIVFLIFAIVCAVKFKDIGFTVSLKEIEPKGLESLALNDKLIEKFDFSTDHSIGVSKTIAEAHELKEQAEDLDSISIIESIANYLPLKNKQVKRLATLREIKKGVAGQVDKKLYLKELAKELKRLRDNIIEISDLAYMSGEKKIVEKCDQLVASKIISELADNIYSYQDSVRYIQNVFINYHQELVRKSNSKKVITMADIPESIKETYIGKDGTFLTTLFPEGDVWSDEFQPIFLKEINSIDTPMTGTSILMSKVMSISGIEGRRILLWVLITIFIVLIIDFRSFKYAALAMIPMGLMLLFLIGTMSIFKFKFDFVNIIALPIVIGIGVDDGVHLIHRYLIEGKLLPTIKSTGRAILLTTLTTMAAFGTMMISTYQGFASFGLVLIMGIGFAYLLTIFLLSALIKVVDGIDG